MDPRNRTIGVVLILVGAAALLVRGAGAGFTWPLFVLVPGLLLLGAAVLGRRDAAGLAVPGSIVSTVGLILLIQNATGTFHSWAYAWALVLAAVGAGRFLQGAFEADAEAEREGLRSLWMGLALFAAFGVAFEFFVFGDRGGALGRYLLPLLLIGGGVWLLRDGRRGGAAAPPAPPASSEEDAG